MSVSAETATSEEQGSAVEAEGSAVDGGGGSLSKLPGFKPLIASYAINDIGDLLAMVALAVYVLDATDSVYALAAMLMASKLVPSFAAPWATARLARPRRAHGGRPDPPARSGLIPRAPSESAPTRDTSARTTRSLTRNSRAHYARASRVDHPSRGRASDTTAR